MVGPGLDDTITDGLLSLPQPPRYLLYRALGALVPCIVAGGLGLLNMGPGL